MVGGGCCVATVRAAVSRERLGTGCHGDSLDEDYDIEMSRVSLDGFEASDGRLQDARVIAALYLARAYTSRGA